MAEVQKKDSTLINHQNHSLNLIMNYFFFNFNLLGLERDVRQAESHI